MDLGDLRGMPKVSGGKTPIARPAASTQGVGEVPPTEASKSSSKRPSDAPVQSDDPSRRHKKVKILSRRHKSCHGEGGSQSHSKGKEPTKPRLLKEARVRARKMDDELLQSVKALESARAELPRQAIDDYKESAGFKEGLKRMGRVTYEYGYRVALTCFRSLHRTRRSRRIPSPSDPRMTWCQWRGNEPLMTRTHSSHNL
ncbi:hypothetical protein B296_00007367 [Ensete ventricosum]|uniref:Uncharacterized protein n=1 Tax=Ensete ventricosum TaxID=4639 RepID=A0A427B925_ENSVE|nr:hypothetical protein B296_00007367 [Ensete ventricosum]